MQATYFESCVEIIIMYLYSQHTLYLAVPLSVIRLRIENRGSKTVVSIAEDFCYRTSDKNTNRSKEGW